MQKASEVDNIEQYYQPISRRVLPPLDIIHETPLFSNIHGTDITNKAATGQTQSQSLLISLCIKFYTFILSSLTVLIQVVSVIHNLRQTL